MVFVFVYVCVWVYVSYFVREIFDQLTRIDESNSTPPRHTDQAAESKGLIVVMHNLKQWHCMQYLWCPECHFWLLPGCFLLVYSFEVVFIES